jgi:glycine/D-amino acid oxidase-like deaminating enzyme
MLNAPATGEAMAELIAGDRTTVDLAAFDPARLPALPRDALGARA